VEGLLVPDAAAIKANRLVRRFDGRVAVNELSFEVRRGEVYGLLGPNGAGKTTTIRMVCGLLPPSGGSVEVFGFDPTTRPIEVKKLVGLVPEEKMLYESLTPKEFFDFIASVRRLPRNVATKRVQSLIQVFDMKEYYNTLIGALSQGTKQKLAVINALIHEPPLLVLDEPLMGLDARSARLLKEFMNIHLEKNGAILFSSHILEVAESLCTRIGILDEGRLVAEGTVNELRELVKSHGSLEDIFLKAVQQDTEVAQAVQTLRQALAEERR
jgi:ABC-2 type transport system ATP-binding protein